MRKYYITTGSDPWSRGGSQSIDAFSLVSSSCVAVVMVVVAVVLPVKKRGHFHRRLLPGLFRNMRVLFRFFQISLEAERHRRVDSV